jgi:outer membrane PBP1 activator LpoA protein
MFVHPDKITGRFFSHALMILLITSFLIGCGANSPKKVTIDLPDQGLTTLTNAAPSDTFVFYVAADSTPQAASDLQQFAVAACTGDGTANRAIQIVIGLGITNASVSGGPSNTECIQSALKTAKTLVVARRSTALPAGVNVVEIVFK